MFNYEVIMQSIRHIETISKAQNLVKSMDFANDFYSNSFIYPLVKRKLLYVSEKVLKASKTFCQVRMKYAPNIINYDLLNGIIFSFSIVYKPFL